MLDMNDRILLNMAITQTFQSYNTIERVLDEEFQYANDVIRLYRIFKEIHRTVQKEQE